MKTHFYLYAKKEHGRGRSLTSILVHRFQYVRPSIWLDHLDSKVVSTLRDSKVVSTLRDSKVVPTLRDSKVVSTLRDSKVVPTLRDSKVVSTLRDSKVVSTHLKLWVAVTRHDFK